MSEKVKGAAIGIDLGTTYSCAAVWFHKKNRVEIIPNEQGNKITPSYVAFNDTEILVGEGAKNQIARNPTNTIFDVKRLIGTRFKDLQVQKDKELWPFKVIEGPSENPTIVVDFKGEEKKYTPTEISAMFLKMMKSAAEKYLGTEVTDVVITVPAYFNNKQREATKEAGTMAGLNVMRLINEPTAAAIAYGVDNKSDKEWDKEKNVLVFDLGGGTFDVSLLTITKTGVINVKAVGGDTHLGGEDFDTTLVNYCVKEFQKKHHENLSGNLRALARLKASCEKAKRDLSSSTLALIEIDCLYKGIDFFTKISRAKFEDLNAPFFDKCINLVDRCLREGGKDKKDVNEVVVVGGSTRIPKVQQMLEDFFDGKTLCNNMNGDEAVAFGAAILAAKLSGYDDVMTKDVMLLDVTPLSLGIDTMTCGEMGHMSVIIPRNTPIPICTKKNYFCDFDDSVYIAVYQGESHKVQNNILLGKFTIRGLTVGANRKSEIEVCFNLDVNGILQVYAEDTTTHQRKSVTIAYS